MPKKSSSVTLYATQGAVRYPDASHAGSRTVALIPSNSQNITPYLDYNYHINPLLSSPIERTSQHSILSPFWWGYHFKPEFLSERGPMVELPRTKLFIPQTRGNLVPRPRLVEQLLVYFIKTKSSLHSPGVVFMGRLLQ